MKLMHTDSFVETSPLL